ncbi:MAG: serine/threonine protein phosphatase [Ruminococcaceae bacterium]|nr:serine/threonine protein phosphatase [Oscillospiraceae bacterium]
MSIFVIADLHLSATADHPMDVFGSRWQGYTQRLCKHWRAVVGEQDTVIVPGDVSWAMHLSEAKADFALLQSLPGTKYLGKGNHDFWWETAAKMGRFFEENGFSSLRLLYNNAYVVENYIVCGTRGWFVEEEQQVTVGDVDYAKIVNREVQRLKISLDAAKRLQADGNEEKEILVFLHFPPVWNGFSCPEILETLQAYGIRRCYHGHIHGVYHVPPKRQIGDLELHMISSDFLDFVPLRII